MSYLEQSTRYIPYDNRLPTGHYRYYRDPEILESSLGARYVGEMDRMFDTYGELMPQLADHLRRSVPKPENVSDVAYRTNPSVRPRSDALRRPAPLPGRSRTSASTDPGRVTSCSCSACGHIRSRRPAGTAR